MRKRLALALSCAAIPAGNLVILDRHCQKLRQLRTVFPSHRAFAFPQRNGVPRAAPEPAAPTTIPACLRTHRTRHTRSTSASRQNAGRSGYAGRLAYPQTRESCGTAAMPGPVRQRQQSYSRKILASPRLSSATAARNRTSVHPVPRAPLPGNTAQSISARRDE